MSYKSYLINKVKVFVVDESALMRKLICDAFESSKHVDLIKVAKNIDECLSELERINYDIDCLIINLNLERDELIGVLAKFISVKFRIIVMVDKDIIRLGMTTQLLNFNNIKIIDKVSESELGNIPYLREKILEEVSSINSLNIRRNLVDIHKAVVIASSTGGPKVLEYIFHNLVTNIDIPIFVVQHMPDGYTKQFVDRLNSTCNYHICEASHGEVIKANVIYIAPSGYHMEIELNKTISLNKGEYVNNVRPAADNLFISASKVYKEGLLGIVLTGMGRDSANGIKWVKDRGGSTIAQDEESCSVFGMPKAAIETGKIDKVLSFEKMIREIMRFANKF